MRDMLKKEKIIDIDVFSRGVAAVYGQTISGGAAAVLSEIGISSQSHRSKPVQKEDIQKADLVLVMEEMHRTVLAQRFGGAEKIFLLKAFVDPELEADLNVHDPIGSEHAVYVQTRLELQDLLVGVLDKIKKQRSSEGSLSS